MSADTAAAGLAPSGNPTPSIAHASAATRSRRPIPHPSNKQCPARAREWKHRQRNADVEHSATMSLWLDGASRSYPPLAGDESADVAVVGAGIAGIATAYFLAAAGARVLLLEARGVAEAASGRNAGFLLAGVAENFVAASRRYGDDKALRIWRLTKRTHELVRTLVARHGIECELRWHGSDQIAGDEEEWREIAESAGRLAAHGARVSVDARTRSA